MTLLDAVILLMSRDEILQIETAVMHDPFVI